MKMRSVLTAALGTWLLCSSALALENLDQVKVTPLLKTQTSWDGTPLQYPQGQAEITGMLVELAPGAATGWHSHPVPSFGMVLEGEIEVTLDNGKTRRIKAGEAVAEVVHTLHNGRNVGPGTLKLIVFYAGAAGGSLTDKPK